MMAGVGDPLMVGHGETRRLLADGAGLCSPGQWPPEQRHPPTGIAARINDALMFELAALGRNRPGGLSGMLADLTSGRLTDSPFPEEATQRLRDYVGELSKGVDVPTDPSQDLQPQPVDVLLLGRVLKLLGDPDWAIMGTYATGVPLGLGVDLPRTPAVFPPELRYPLKEQLEWEVPATGQRLTRGLGVPTTPLQWALHGR